MRTVVTAVAVAVSLSCTLRTNEVSVPAPEPLWNDGFVTYFSRPGQTSLVTVGTIAVDDFGCRAEALEAARKVARRMRGDAMIVECMGPRGRLIPWETSAPGVGTWVRATIIQFPWLWSRRGG